MFQVNHRNCLAAGEYFLALETAPIINHSVSAGPIYDDIWNFPTRAGSQLGLRVNFGVAQKVHAFLARSELDGVLGLGFAPYVSHNLLVSFRVILTLISVWSERHPGPIL
jgi:hypothetical protein